MACPVGARPRIQCGVVTSERRGSAGFRGIVWTDPAHIWHGPHRQRYIDAVADAEGHAREVYRAGRKLIVAH